MKLAVCPERKTQQNYVYMFLVELHLFAMSSMSCFVRMIYIKSQQIDLMFCSTVLFELSSMIMMKIHVSLNVFTQKSTYLGIGTQNHEYTMGAKGHRVDVARRFVVVVRKSHVVALPI